MSLKIRINGITKKERRRIVKFTKWTGIILLIFAAIFGSDVFSVEDEEYTTQEYEEYTIPENDEFISIGSFERKLHYVTNIIDGDTIMVDNNIEIRLIGIDAPEKGECYYEEASVAVDELIGERYVRLEKDISGSDSFGRLLRYVFLPGEIASADDIFINRELLKQGYADIRPKTQDIRYRTFLTYSNNQAITGKEGMWGACEQENKEKEGVHPMEANDLPTDPLCLIKGNISKDGYGKTYFLSHCANYKRIKIDYSKGENYFCNEDEAIAAGFRKVAGCK